MKKQILCTNNYRLFQVHDSENRSLEIKKHKRLERSMKKNGFNPNFPIVVFKDPDTGILIIKDGQHRHYFAELFGLMVYYTVSETDFDIAEINSTAKVWSIIDYAKKHAANGKKAYQEAIDFAEHHSLPIGKALAILGGTTTFGNLEPQVIDGEFKIKDKPYAEMVASVYSRLTVGRPQLKNARFLDACCAVCRVEKLDAKRLFRGADRCPDKLISYSTREAYLEMLEEIYNFRSKELVGLKLLSVMAMRARNIIKK